VCLPNNFIHPLAIRFDMISSSLRGACHEI
jgi:hypothetical protein